MRFPLGSAVTLALASLFVSGAARAQAPAQAAGPNLQLDRCVGVSAEALNAAVRRELAAELGALARSTHVRLALRCGAEGAVLLRLDDALTGARLERSVRAQGSARLRELALAVTELLAQRWLELEVLLANNARRPPGSAEPAAPSSARRREASEEPPTERAAAPAPEAPARVALGVAPTARFFFPASSGFDTTAGGMPALWGARARVGSPRRSPLGWAAGVAYERASGAVPLGVLEVQLVSVDAGIHWDVRDGRVVASLGAGIRGGALVYGATPFEGRGGTAERGAAPWFGPRVSFAAAILTGPRFGLELELESGIVLLGANASLFNLRELSLYGPWLHMSLGVLTFL